MTRGPERALLFALLLAGCRGEQAMLDTLGPGAGRIETMWWAMLAVSVLVYGAVLVLLVHGAFRQRDDDRANGRHHAGLGWIVGGGVVVPAVVLTPLFLWTLHEIHRMSPAAEPHSLTIQVTGRQYWWDVRYVLGAEGSRVERVRTANEIRIPVGQRVRLELTSQDVIHSLWIPALQGKTDLLPGRVTTTWIEASQPGRVRGQCAEFCGRQHTRMALAVVAEPEAEFSAWLRAQQAPAVPPADSLAAQGQQVFLGTACALCHAIRGTAARAEVAPDLTHIASRLTLAAGQLPNTSSHLASWVGNPQILKPGSQMPRVPLSSEELGALLHYLGTLR